MPRLLYFVVCEKVSIDRDDGSLSLLGVLNSLNVIVPADIPPGEHDATLFRWTAVACWLRQPEDEGRIYEQRIMLIPPVGTLLEGGVAETAFTMTERVRYNRTTADRFPVGYEGEYQIVISLREQQEGQEGLEWQEISRYPIELIYEQRPAE